MSYYRSSARDIAERVLAIHGIPNESESLRQGERPRQKINAIIRDIQAANAAAEDEADD